MASEELDASTPEAAKAVAQTRGGEAPGPPPRDIPPEAPGEGTRYTLGPRVYRAIQLLPYERKRDDPLYRPLRIYTQDPSASKLEGSVALINIPYERLEPGPVSHLFRVDGFDLWQQVRYQEVDLDEPFVLIRNGRDPSPSDPRFHQQMVYAVCSTAYAAFRRALGRHIAWGFERESEPDGKPPRLLIRPHGPHERNAYYDEQAGELVFGYYRAEEEVLGRNLPRGYVFTCLSHDIVVHEVTHALLDGLRSHFTRPTGPDVLAFHEGFADLVALFQHFSYQEVLLAGIRQSRARLERSELLTDLARQFGHTSGARGPLRSAVQASPRGEPARYDETLEPHQLGSVLVSAVFEAFVTLFKRKTERYVRLATGGTGVLRAGELPRDLQELLAEKASRLASQFLTICIRAVDYCPPVDLEFGEFLRAVITADHDLVPDDRWGYREAWIDAFRRRHIYPRDVPTLSEDALLWNPASRAVPLIEPLSFAELRFAGDPAKPASLKELRRQACALGEVVTRPENLEVFGLTGPRDTSELPRVESIRTSRRIGPDGQITFDLVAEVTQQRRVRDPATGESFEAMGGCTVIIGPDGDIRYVISKRVTNEERLERQRRFLQSEQGARFWSRSADGHLAPRKQALMRLHAAKEEAPSR